MHAQYAHEELNRHRRIHIITHWIALCQKLCGHGLQLFQYYISTFFQSQHGLSCSIVRLADRACEYWPKESIVHADLDAQGEALPYYGQGWGVDLLGE